MSELPICNWSLRGEQTLAKPARRRITRGSSTRTPSWHRLEWWCQSRARQSSWIGHIVRCTIQALTCLLPYTTLTSIGMAQIQPATPHLNRIANWTRTRFRHGLNSCQKREPSTPIMYNVGREHRGDARSIFSNCLWCGIRRTEERIGRWPMISTVPNTVHRMGGRWMWQYVWSAANSSSRYRNRGRCHCPRQSSANLAAS